jgi:hypothetical protein
MSNITIAYPSGASTRGLKFRFSCSNLFRQLGRSNHQVVRLAAIDGDRQKVGGKRGRTEATIGRAEATISCRN